MADETPPEPPPEAEPEADDPSKLERAAAFAAFLLHNKELIVAAMEALRERKVLTEEEEVKVVAAYEEGSFATRSAIHDLLQKLQESNLGRVVIDLKKGIEGEAVSPQRIRDVAQPYFAAAKEAISSEAQPYLERARQRLVELKALEEPTLRRLEAVSENFRAGSKEVVGGLKGVGREAADELVKRGKRLWMSPETEELEREFFDWTLKNLPKAEQAFVRLLLGMGLLLLLAGVLVAAREFTIMEEVAVFISIFLLIFLGLAFLNWGIKISEGIKLHRGEIEKLAAMPPTERRIYLTQKWAKRAQAEGLITSTEAQSVIEETIHAIPEARAGASGPETSNASAPTRPR